MNRRQCLTLTAALAAGSLAGCTGSADAPASSNAGADSSGDADTTATKTATPKPKAEDVEILSHEPYTEEYGGFGVRGEAKNVSGGTLSYVAIETVFLDAEGTQVAEGLDNVTELAADRTWAFDSMAMSTIDPSTVDSYEISVEVNDY